MEVGRQQYQSELPESHPPLSEPPLSHDPESAGAQSLAPASHEVLESVFRVWSSSGRWSPAHPPWDAIASAEKEADVSGWVEVLATGAGRVFIARARRRGWTGALLSSALMTRAMISTMATPMMIPMMVEG